MTRATSLKDERNGGDDENHFAWMLRWFVISLFTFCPLFALIVWARPVHADPTFSVRVNGARGLDPTCGPVIRPGFNLTLRVDNDQDFTSCREDVTVTVFYGGTVVVGSADVPEFCVDKRSSAELSVPLSHADVVLTNELRWRMAVELRSGELELGVEMRLVFPKGLGPLPWGCIECHESRSRQSFQMCRVKPEQGYAPCQRLLLI
ncbi:unnamed protein product [Urochloa decumbens]|uniref:Uncharacterized protein n=1 Tax=Urochloa decumbens TaxID=240449 RepID=A0ABC9AC08_9POAL